MADSKLSPQQVLARSFDDSADKLKVDAGTVTVGLPTGASTAALQTTGNTSLGNINTGIGTANGWLEDIDSYISTFLDAPISGIDQPKYKTNIDEASGTVTYVGRALPGTATSAASWQVSKFTLTGNVLAETNADGNFAFDNIWDDRASLTYT